jgi:GT2 family glycosyltransferase
MRESVVGSGLVGLVAIGRNEGERLRRCFRSVPASIARVVYVDSGSVDGSIELARVVGAEVVELGSDVPFTAARARNAGIARLTEVHASIEFFFVVDGDCEIVSGFVEAALVEMASAPEVAVVCGRRRERFRDASIYNALCDMEWNTPVGEAEACGGDALIRASAFRQVGGYDGAIIAGEEPELCLRLRREGWRVRRIDRDMTLHDAAITRFGQWWRRAVRAGHAYAELFVRHRHWASEVRSFVFYGALIPLAAFVAAPSTSGWSLALFGVYGLLYLRVRALRRRAGDVPRDAALYALFCVVAKFAHVAGAARFVANRVFGRKAAIIEYKQVAHGGASESS